MRSLVQSVYHVGIWWDFSFDHTSRWAWKKLITVLVAGRIVFREVSSRPDMEKAFDETFLLVVRVNRFDKNDYSFLCRLSSLSTFFISIRLHFFLTGRADSCQILTSRTDFVTDGVPPGRTGQAHLVPTILPQLCSVVESNGGTLYLLLVINYKPS